jgi:hypothetical protein
MVAGGTDPYQARSKGRVAAALVLGGAALVAALVLGWPFVLLPAGTAVAALVVLNRRQVRALFNKWLWLGLAVAVVVPIWVIGTPGELERAHAGRGLPALTAGVTMAVRVLTALAAMLLIGGCVAPATVSRGLGRFVGRDLGLACAIGVNLLPAILEILRRTTLALRLRGGFRRHRLANLKRLVTAVGVQTVRLTEDVAEALLLAQVPARATGESEPEPQGPQP